MTENTPVPLNRIERVLATVAASVGGLSIVSIIGLIVARAVGFTDFTTALWPAVRILPLYGLPIALLALIAFFVVRLVHQRRIARDGGN